MTNASIPDVNMLKNSSTLAASVPINLSIKLGFVFVNGPKANLFCGLARYYFPLKNSSPLILSFDFFMLFKNLIDP